MSILKYSNTLFYYNKNSISSTQNGKFSNPKYIPIFFSLKHVI